MLQCGSTGEAAEGVRQAQRALSRRRNEENLDSEDSTRRRTAPGASRSAFSNITNTNPPSPLAQTGSGSGDENIPPTQMVRRSALSLPTNLNHRCFQHSSGSATRSRSPQTPHEHERQRHQELVSQRRREGQQRRRQREREQRAQSATIAVSAVFL